MNERSLADSWFIRIASFRDPTVRYAFAQRELYSAEPQASAEAFDEVCQRVDHRHKGGREALTAFVPTLTHLKHIDRVEQVRTAAIEGGYASAERLLRCSTRAHHGEDDKRQRALEGALERNGRPLSLGERRALARQPKRATLVKLLRDPHPMVASLLLRNPRVTEEDVLLMACRRPSISTVLHEVTQTWFHSARVRMAIVLNPGSPPAISVPLLGLLVRRELAEAVTAMDIVPTARDTARELYDLRPPIDKASDSRLDQEETAPSSPR